jgi:hypothetical protein
LLTDDEDAAIQRHLFLGSFGEGGKHIALAVGCVLRAFRIAEAASSSATRHHKQMTASEGVIERDDDPGDDVPRGRSLDVRLPDDLTGGGAGMATFSSTTLKGSTFTTRRVSRNLTTRSTSSSGAEAPAVIGCCGPWPECEAVVGAKVLKRGWYLMLKQPEKKLNHHKLAQK